MSSFGPGEAPISKKGVYRNVRAAAENASQASSHAEETARKIKLLVPTRRTAALAAAGLGTALTGATYAGTKAGTYAGTRPARKKVKKSAFGVDDDRISKADDDLSQQPPKDRKKLKYAGAILGTGILAGHGGRAVARAAGASAKTQGAVFNTAGAAGYVGGGMGYAAHRRTQNYGSVG